MLSLSPFCRQLQVRGQRMMRKQYIENHARTWIRFISSYFDQPGSESWRFNGFGQHVRSLDWFLCRTLRSGGAAAQALRALRRAAQLHSERRTLASTLYPGVYPTSQVEKPGKVEAAKPRRGMQCFKIRLY